MLVDLLSRVLWLLNSVISTQGFNIASDCTANDLLA